MIRLALLLLALFAAPVALAEPLVNRALSDAIAAFERAAPHLGQSEFGVETKAYADALMLGRFTSGHWGAPVQLAIASAEQGDPGCARYAAYVRLPPRNGQVLLVICPQFSAPGADALRRLTILHEMVHVVAGPDECRAMAFAARIEQLALGHFTPVEPYWRANGCQHSAFAMP